MISLVPYEYYWDANEQKLKSQYLCKYLEHFNGIFTTGFTRHLPFFLPYILPKVKLMDSSALRDDLQEATIPYYLRRRKQMIIICCILIKDQCARIHLWEHSRLNVSASFPKGEHFSRKNIFPDRRIFSMCSTFHGNNLQSLLFNQF